MSSGDLVLEFGFTYPTKRGIVRRRRQMARIAALFVALPGHTFRASELQHTSGIPRGRLDRILDSFVDQRWIIAGDTDEDPAPADRCYHASEESHSHLAELVRAGIQ